MLADVNRDGRLDAIGTDRWWIGIALGQGDGTFVPTGLTRADDDPDFPMTQLLATATTVADLNADGHLDVVTYETGMQRRFLRYYAGNGAGAFLAPARHFIVEAPQGPLVSAVGDYNGDGFIDVAVSEPNCSTLQLLINNGQGAFSFQPFCAAPRVFQAQWMIAADLDGNAAPDLAGTYNSTLSIVLGNGDGTHQPRRDVMPAEWCTQPNCWGLGRLAAADLNMDGVVDLALINGGGKAVVVLTAANPGDWRSSAAFSTPNDPGTLSIADLNNDGRQDIVATNGGTISLFLNTTTPSQNFVSNGDFAAGGSGWLVWPGANELHADAATGQMHFYRRPGASDGALLQPTGRTLPAGAPIDLVFRLANTDTVRKRISVIVHDGDWSDLALCTFWLTPQQPSRLYVMRARTLEPWSNATLSFYASTVNTSGSTGAYVLDDVALRAGSPGSATAKTECVDPSRPWFDQPTATSNIITNGDFSSGSLAPWLAWSDLRWQLASGSPNPLLSFFGAKAGAALLQPTGVAAAKGQRFRATLRLGNSSGTRQRVTVMLHDGDFSDLTACHFWLPAGAPIGDYTMTTFASDPWSNATLSIYTGTVGSSPSHEWLQLDDVMLQSTSDPTSGTMCHEPGAVPNVQNTAPANAVAPRATRTSRSMTNGPSQSQPASPRTPAPPIRGEQVTAGASIVFRTGDVPSGAIVGLAEGGESTATAVPIRNPRRRAAGGGMGKRSGTRQRRNGRRGRTRDPRSNRWHRRLFTERNRVPREP